MDLGIGAIRMHSLPLNLKMLSLPAVLCVSCVCTGAALPRPEAGDLHAQLITATCPASLSLGLKDCYLWLLSLSLPWGVSDPLVQEEKHRPATAPAGSRLSPRLPSSNSDLALLQDPGTHCRMWCGGRINCRFYLCNEWLTLRPAASL